MNLAVALNVRSDFSVGRSMMQVDQIIARAKELGYQTVALTDEMSLHAAIPFINAAKKAGIKPIVGCTLRVCHDPTYRPPKKSEGIPEIPNPAYMLRVYLKGEAGMKSLLKLLTKANTPEYFYYHSRVGLTDVLDLEDVVVTTGDFQTVYQHAFASDVVGQLALRFGADFYAELVPVNTPLFDTLNAAAIDAARFHQVDTVVTYPFLYREEDDAASMDILTCVTSNTREDAPWRSKQYVKDFAFAAPQALVEKMKGAVLRHAHWDRLASSHEWVT
ncbi:PHP domain-containing protein, partial [Burkholderia gladioli]|uniref:PHP domain-containing protein n=1 Tax=Burkholderia gladioli TaxID=28095 RepID=UPI003B503080